MCTLALHHCHHQHILYRNFQHRRVTRDMRMRLEDVKEKETQNIKQKTNSKKTIRKQTKEKHKKAPLRLFQLIFYTNEFGLSWD